MRNWVDRHFVETSVLIIFITFTISAIFLVIFAFFPQTPAAANSVRTTTQTASCATGQSNDLRYGVMECKVKLKDGRTVTCVNILSGTSCDWAHATIKKDK